MSLRNRELVFLIPALVLTTLGAEMDEQRIETIYGHQFRHFILHYNFPPYSVGEAKRLGGPGRQSGRDQPT